ncbi:MAG: MgtE intracellular region [Synergistales bacterium]|nr:MgtE intracellular region [Synergistales bacterium]
MVDQWQEEEPQEQRTPKPAGKKPKRGSGKARGCGCLLLTLLIAGGLLTGLTVSGVWDPRPMLYETLPGIPVVGPRLAGLAGVPEEYSLTPEERRAQELAERKALLEQREASLDIMRRRLMASSGDLARRREELLALEQQLAAQRAKLAEQEDSGPGASEEQIEELLGVYGEMSARRAAEVFAGLKEELAVELLSRLSNEQAADILGKMEPQKAARLTEQLADRR